jgi:hypothetical protein
VENSLQEVRKGGLEEISGTNRIVRELEGNRIRGGIGWRIEMRSTGEVGTRSLDCSMTGTPHEVEYV